VDQVGTRKGYAVSCSYNCDRKEAKPQAGMVSMTAIDCANIYSNAKQTVGNRATLQRDRCYDTSVGVFALTQRNRKAGWASVLNYQYEE
jgi:hypothetical protein